MFLPLWLACDWHFFILVIAMLTTRFSNSTFSVLVFVHHRNHKLAID